MTVIYIKNLFKWLMRFMNKRIFLLGKNLKISFGCK